jgi:hypothetical protein
MGFTALALYVQKYLKYSSKMGTTYNLKLCLLFKDPTQVCCSTPKKPFITYKELILLYNGYTKLADLLRRSGPGGVKMMYQIEERYALFAWITPGFELYCKF